MAIGGLEHLSFDRLRLNQFGYELFSNPLIPRKHVGDEIKPIWPHELIQWIWRLFGWKVWPICYVRGKRIEEEQVFILGNKMFCSPAVFKAFKEIRP